MTTDPLEKIRDGLLRGVAAEPRRSRRRRTLAAAAAVVLFATGAGLVLASPWDDSTDDAVTASEGAGAADNGDDEATSPAPQPIWAIEEPPAWRRAGRELMPHLGWDTLTLATVPLRGGGARCAQMPEQALRDLGADDALVSIFFDVSPPDDASAWPTGPSDLPEQESSTAEECAERDDLETRWGHVARGGVAFYVLVAFGPDASDAVRDQTWVTLASFRPLGGSVRARAPECVVTLPPSGQEEMPTTDGTGPLPGTGWVGTPDLWTALPLDGVHRQRKSIWWSQHFPGGSIEERPEIRVTWLPPAPDGPPIVAEPPGTNGHSVDTGWFMLNGMDPEAPGCWSVTAQYKGHELSYAYWNPAAGASADGDARCTAEGPGTVVVPDVVGTALAEAIDTAMAAGLDVVDSGTPPGDPTTDDALVTSQEPPAGARVPEGACLGFRTTISGVDSHEGPHIGAPGASAKDVAEGFMDAVLDDPSIAVSASDIDRRTTVVRLETSTGAIVDATVTADPGLGRHVLQEIRSPGLELDETNRATITVPEPGRLTVTGYDGVFSSPGEVMIEAEPVTEAGPVGPLDLPESSWVRIDLEVADGRVLHLVQTRA